jgi:hypothetical protein
VKAESDAISGVASQPPGFCNPSGAKTIESSNQAARILAIIVSSLVGVEYDMAGPPNPLKVS